MNRLIFLGTTLAVLASCSYTDPGTGSGTLQVTALVSYVAGATDTNHVEIKILDDAGRPLSGATVKLTDDATGDSFIPTEQDIGTEPGLYSTSFNTYRRRLELSISKENHSLLGKLEGPSPHTIDNPSFGQSIKRADLGDTMTVSWNTTDGMMADLVTVNLDENRFVNTLSKDQGEGEIPSQKLNSGTEGITIKRRNRVFFAEGLNDSTFEMAYSVRLTVQIQ